MKIMESPACSLKHLNINLSAVSSLLTTSSSTDEIPTNDIAFVGICRHLQVEDWYAVDYDGILYRDSILYPGSLVR